MALVVIILNDNYSTW